MGPAFVSMTAIPQSVSSRTSQGLRVVSVQCLYLRTTVAVARGLQSPPLLSRKCLLVGRRFSVCTCAIRPAAIGFQLHRHRSSCSASHICPTGICLRNVMIRFSFGATWMCAATFLPALLILMNLSLLRAIEDGLWNATLFFSSCAPWMIAANLLPAFRASLKQGLQSVTYGTT